MSYEIHPLRGVVDIDFGMSVDQVRALMSGNFELFQRAPLLEQFKDDHPSDYYEDQGVFCYYDRAGHLEAMEFTEPAIPLVGGLNLLAMSFPQAAAVLARLDPDVVREPDMVTSRRWSLSVWSEEGEDGPVDSFLAGRPGYYDFLDDL